MRIGEAAKRLHVTTQTVRTYIKQGKLECDYTPNGQRIINERQLNDFLGTIPNDTRDTACYIRSSAGRQQELDSQLNKIKTRYPERIRIYKDKASGLNENRPGLNRLIKDIKQGKIKAVIITNKDRLTRFGYAYLEQLFQAYDCDITILDTQESHEDLNQELMRDFMSLIASFSGKFYQLRGYRQQQQLLQDAEQEIKESIDKQEANKAC